MRGSDVNAALHYLARLIEAGDLQSIGRRLLIMAYEDIGLASPQAGPRTLAQLNQLNELDSQKHASHLQMPLSSYAYHQNQIQLIKHLIFALHDLRNGQTGDIPSHLKDSHYKGAESLGRGIGYLYPHDHQTAG